MVSKAGTVREHVRPLRLGVLARRSSPSASTWKRYGPRPVQDPADYPSRTTTSRPGPRCRSWPRVRGSGCSTCVRWGLVPAWAKSVAVGDRMINARAESLLTSNAYKRPFERRRCIVPADGFYEWQTIEGQKVRQPWFIRRRDGEPIAFAGLWSIWHDKKLGDDAPRIRSCTIITTEPNDLMREIHDRMPVMLAESAWDTWLDPENHDVEVLGQLLVPVPSEELEAVAGHHARQQARQQWPGVDQGTPPTGPMKYPLEPRLLRRRDPYERRRARGRGGEGRRRRARAVVPGVDGRRSARPHRPVAPLGRGDRGRPRRPNAARTGRRPNRRRRPSASRGSQPGFRCSATRSQPRDPASKLWSWTSDQTQRFLGAAPGARDRDAPLRRAALRGRPTSRSNGCSRSTASTSSST